MMTLIALAGCGRKAEKIPALSLSNLDTTVSPGEDFYRYATGGWQAANPLKPEFSRFGSFDKLSEDNVVRLNDLFASMTTMKTVPGTVEQKIVDLYKQGLDSVRMNADGTAPIKAYLEQIYAAPDKEALAKVIASMHDYGDSPFFDGGVEADLMNSEMQIFYLSQSGLGMRDRDYYLKAENAALKEGYRKFLGKVFAMTGAERPEVAADNAVFVEEVLALKSWTREQTRDYVAQYNPMSSKQIQETYKGFPFEAYFAARGIPEQEKIIVCMPSFFEAFSKYYAEADLLVLKDYVAGRLISGACDALGDEMYAAYFDFFSAQMSGIKEQKPRWKRAMQVPNSILGEAVGKMYVQKYFPESSKERMLELVANLQTALGEHIRNLDWMQPETKLKALEKLEAFTVKIGYPDKWKDYSSLEVNPEKTYYENLRAASRWYVADNMSKLGKPTDKTEWGMPPQMVNAYYNPTTNEICFPAAILQPPFFNPDADDAVNYGGIGVVIGHEMTHGFDDQGRLFDKNGNMNDWWTPEDAAAFKQKSQALVKQFDEVEVLPGVFANGTNTLGENIADHGGLSVAYTALQNALKGKNVAPIDGFTPEQRFYLSYAAIWAQNITDEEKARLTNLDVHSLAVNRVNVSLRNFGTFFDAFGIKEGDPMFRPESERVSIW